MMRARRRPAAARGSPPPLRLTGDLLQLKDDPPRVGATGMPGRTHSPFATRRGQFFLDVLAFEEQAHRVRTDKPLCQWEKLVQRARAARTNSDHGGPPHVPQPGLRG